MNYEELRLTFPSAEAHPSHADIALEGHSFKLRQIQCSIIRLTKNVEYEAQSRSIPVPNLWRSYPKTELDVWVADAKALSTDSCHHSRFLSREWLCKLADYTTISLFPNPALAVRSGESKFLCAAATAALCSFRKLRVRENTTCFTWTAVRSTVS